MPRTLKGLDIRKDERKRVFKEILKWANRGALTTYPTHWFIAGLKAIEESVKAIEESKGEFGMCYGERYILC